MHTLFVGFLGRFRDLLQVLMAGFYPQRTFRWGGLRGYGKGGRGHAVASQAKPELLALLT